MPTRVYLKTEEHRIKLSASGKIAMNRPEVRAKLSAAKTGDKHPLFGKRHSDKTIAKMSAAQKQKWQDPERQARISMVSRQNWQDPEIRARMTAAIKKARNCPVVKAGCKIRQSQKWQDPECRARMIAAMNRPEVREKHRAAIAGDKNPNFGNCHSDRTKTKISVALTGDKNPHWRGGLSRFPYPISFNGKLKREIRERDVVCQLCGMTKEENGQNLSIHHIDYDKHNLDLSNLVALCRSCNSVVNSNRNYWVSVFVGRNLWEKFFGPLHTHLIREEVA